MQSLGRRATALFVVTALALAAIAVTRPVPLMVIGLVVLGLTHVALELRYIIGRFATTLTSTVAYVLLIGLTVTALGRVAQFAGFTTPGRIVEALSGLALIAYGVALAWRGTGRLIGWAVVAAFAVAAVLQPAWYAHVITHIHNFVPVLFLWDWARRNLRHRTAFYAATALWSLIVPALILIGVFDGLTSTSTGLVSWWVLDGPKQLAALGPPGASTAVAIRFGMLFAFLQSMHYVVWIGFFPWAGRAETRDFERAVPALAGRRFLAITITLAIALLAVFVVDYSTGKNLYSIVASYHVYVEAPLALVLLAGLRRSPDR